MSIYKKKQGRFAGKIPAVQGIFHTERQGSPNLQKQETVSYTHLTLPTNSLV